MGKIIEITPNSPEWHNWRSWKIGSSDAAAIMGVNPFKSKLQLWKEKVLGETTKETEAMRRGTLLEGAARNQANENFMAQYSPCCMEHDIYPCIIASLDGYDKLAPFPILEIKCPGPGNFAKALTGEVADYYYPQLQHQMMVANAHSCLYYAFDGERGVDIPVTRDDEYCEALLKAELEFYSSMINYRPPTPEGFNKIEDESKERLSKLYEDIGLLIDNFQEIREDIKERLIEACNGANSIIGNLRISRIERKGNIDYEKIELLKTLDLEQYRKPPSVSWRLAPAKE